MSDRVASPRVYLDLLNDLAENLITHGFRRIVFINGHGGNITPGKQAIFEIRQRHRDRSDLLLLFASYWDNANPNAGRADLVQSQMGHACEWETSMMLRLAPHLVKDYKRAEPVGFGFGFEPAYRGWTTKDRTVTGHLVSCDCSFARAPQGWVTPAKVTRSATVKSPAVTEGRIGAKPPATFR
jgi:creatinine amidohydrolase